MLTVTRLDRLARSTRDLLNILAEISKHGAQFKSLADSWADKPDLVAIDGNGLLRLSITHIFLLRERRPMRCR